MNAGTGDRGPGTGKSSDIRQACAGANVAAAELDASVKRLRWRCRRGTRELDDLLGGWLDRHGSDADPAALSAFGALLEQQDPEIQDWLLGRAEPPDEAWREIVIEIRRHAGLVR